MKRKRCIITGANAGIGKEATVQIANKGYHVIMACRNEQRGVAALEEVKAKLTDGSVELMLVDLSLQSSIKAFARKYLKKYDTLDVLIHNAAQFDTSQKKPVFTEEGIERVWATNHLGPVLLTDLLLNVIKNSPQGRVITIASKGLVTFPFLKIRLDDPEFRQDSFSVVKAYYQTKLAQVMYTYWLSNKLSNTRVTVNCIRVTNVKIDIDRYPNIGPLAKLAYKLKSRFSITPEEMAETYTYLATSPEVTSMTGKYIDEKNRIVQSSAYSQNQKNRARMMDMTMNFIKNV